MTTPAIDSGLRSRCGTIASLPCPAHLPPEPGERLTDRRQDDDGKRARRPSLVVLVAVRIVHVDDLPQARVVGFVRQHGFRGNREPPWANVDFNVRLGLNVVVPAGRAGIAALGRDDQIVVGVPRVCEGCRALLTSFGPGGVQQQAWRGAGYAVADTAIGALVDPVVQAQQGHPDALLEPKGSVHGVSLADPHLPCQPPQGLGCQ